MEIWRLLKLETYNAFMNMAIDEAVLRTRTRDLVPNTIRFYRWNPSAVSIGRFQDLGKEVQLDNCIRHGVDVVRRISGGGAVFHESEHEVTYGVITDKENIKTPGITSVYSKIYAGLAEAISILGLRADFDKGNMRSCPNLTVDSKKISGSAQSHSKGFVLQHGTLLTDVDFEKMFTFLRVPWVSTLQEIKNVAERRITSIRKELKRDISAEKIEVALVEGFERALNIQLEEGKLTPYEEKLAKELHDKRYTKDEWNLHGRKRLFKV